MRLLWSVRTFLWIRQDTCARVCVCVCACWREWKWIWRRRMQWLPGLINNLQWEPGQTHMKTHSSIKGERWEQQISSLSFTLTFRADRGQPPPPPLVSDLSQLSLILCPQYLHCHLLMLFSSVAPHRHAQASKASFKNKTIDLTTLELP